jgi:gluconate 5-dehydrogenase
MNRLFSLDGKVALITGSSRGLGLVLARGLGQAGAHVIINGRNEDDLLHAAESLQAEGLSATPCVFDVTDKTQIHTRIGELEEAGIQIDVLINNAGVHLRGDLAEIEFLVWQEVLNTNLTGAFLAAQRVVKGMIARKSGKIINICSLMSELGRPTTGTYAASKGGLKMLTRAMAVDWAQHNIQVNGIGPGYFLTAMTRVLAEDKAFDAWYKNRTPARRWGNPHELIGTAIFLASEASSFINGQIIYVDGGLLASM